MKASENTTKSGGAGEGRKQVGGDKLGKGLTRGRGGSNGERKKKGKKVRVHGRRTRKTKLKNENRVEGIR